MGFKRRNHRKVFSIAAAFLMTLSLATPSIGPAAATSKLHTSVHDTSKATTAKEKISSRLASQFKEDEMVTFMIKFKEQADTTKVAKEAKASAQKAKLSAEQSKYLQRSAVVSELKATALETQSSVEAYLEKEVAKGNARGIRSYFIVNGMGVTATKEVAEKVASFPEVEKILPNETRQLHATKTKTAKETAKQTNNIEWNIDRVGAPQAWNLGIDGTGTVVASIDTGVQWDHPALKEKYRGFNKATGEVSHDFNWFDSTSANRATPYDDLEHGTHVTGTMVGGEPNGANQIGVAPGAKWIAVKAFTAAGGTDYDLLEAADWIMAPTDANGNARPDLAPDVVNNSWGGGPGLDEWYLPAVVNWRNAQIFPEFSAGNVRAGNPGGPGSVANPANYRESFATGATDINNKLASFSLQGPSPYGEIKPDISAPGVNIRSSIPGGSYEGGWNGTSMAGPHVSAVAAMLRQVNASITVDEMEEILMSTATPLTDSTFPESPNNGYGYGLVNAFDAVSSIISGMGRLEGQVGKQGEDTEAPTFSHQAPAETYAGMDLELFIEVSDNVSVASVNLEYKDQDNNWQTIAATRTSGDFKSGTYRAKIDGDKISGNAFIYRWKLNDFGNNEVTSDEYTINVMPGISVGYFTDFESTPTGWTSFGDKDPWQWGVPTSGPNGAASGQKVYGTNLAGNYENYTNATLVMPPIDLPEGNAFLQFKHWYDFENNWDFGHVFVSTDRQNWTQVMRITGNGASWRDAEVDLSAYSGQRIYVGFNLRSDVSVVRAGWYLDDVRLSATSNTGKASIGLKGISNKKADSVSSDNVALKKEKVDPNKIVPEMPKKETPPVADGAPAPEMLPLNAKVSVLEIGRSVNTDPANGRYSMNLAAGDYTVQAEAYGYRPAQQTVNIGVDATVTANFVLEEKSSFTLSGKVTNESNGEPVANANLLLVEDAAVTPVKTDANGNYSITAYEGTYTLKVVAPFFHSQEIEVTFERNSSLDVVLKPIISYPGGEIGYDDGVPENARAFYDAGNGWGVKMSLPEGKNKGVLTAGVFRFWDTEWPIPGGTAFKVEIWDATGA
ncbi:MAG TPA: S8 family serine peptidase, partial [Bacillaceae bacterium]